MKRRILLGTTLALAGCGLSERPYLERRDWPLVINRPVELPARASGKVLLVRSVRAGPGLDARGLQSVQPDGSIRTEFYEEWAVTPAHGVEDALRRWLAASGLFAAVVAPGSRLDANLILEGELTALWSEPAQGRARAALAITVVEARGETTRARIQRTFTAEARLPEATPPAEAAAMRAALATVFGQIEAALSSV